MAVEEAYELAYREAVRALEHQRAEAAALQSRAGMLLAAASIAVSMLGRDVAMDAISSKLSDIASRVPDAR